MDKKRIVTFLLGLTTLSAIKLYGDRRHTSGWVEGATATLEAYTSEKNDESKKEEE